MKKISLAVTLLLTTVVGVVCAQIYIDASLDAIMEPIEAMERNEGDIHENAKNIITTYAERQRWLLLIVDNNIVLNIGVAVSVLDENSDPDDIYFHARHIKAEIERSRSLLFTLF